jgi:hypothetical protein
MTGNIRELKEEDVPVILKIYREAFRGYPWFEDLSEEIVSSRWSSDSAKHSFSCLVAEIDEKVIGATWWDVLTHKELASERGELLVNFSKKFDNTIIVWERELIVKKRKRRSGAFY